jgi:hypothetical protein
MSREVAAEPGMSYEAVLEAVQESSRGRWFLNEFKSRNAGLDSSQILSAIARLESRMESLSSQGGGDAADELARVRQAIATTRKDILKASGAPGLSEEGKLFAHLAELARKSLTQGSTMSGTLPGSEALPGSIVQALRLVDQIDFALNSGPSPGRKPETPYTDNFFGRDSDLLMPQSAHPAPPAMPRPALVPPPAPMPSPKPQPVNAMAKAEAPVLGAKLTVSRQKPPEPQKQEEISPATAAPAASTDSEGSSRPRILISRLKPEEMPAPEADTSLPTENAA